MWEAESEPLDGATIKVILRAGSAPISVGTALELCRTRHDFRALLIGELASPRFAAFFWEMPPITASALHRPFEFVIAQAASLAGVAPESEAFEEHFAHDEDGDGVVT